MIHLYRLEQTLPQIIGAIITIIAIIAGAVNGAGSSNPNPGNATQPAPRPSVTSENLVQPNSSQYLLNMDYVNSITVNGQTISDTMVRTRTTSDIEAYVGRDDLNGKFKTLTFSLAWDDNIKRREGIDSAVVKVYLGKNRAEYAKSYVVKPGQVVNSGPINISGLDKVLVEVEPIHGPGLAIFNARLHR
ncbi:hypothetical protein [Corynebacterium minutissimum]|uniref:hypothetical protein n=1 Tax=Corynebacterium minutissimum TaxID=38301 RepID=UPI001EF3CF13|nr:hypothetical protein [Corynebacterium minutissimum]MCG7230536.1 hypothetical protein [Corynebacterium minutissimum]MCG7239694.1 hypothetical protein [Corynebacterium minutissimum]